jgi:hypothetical protein
MRFPMTTDGWVKFTTLMTLVLVVFVLPNVALATNRAPIPEGVTVITHAAQGFLLLVLLWTVLAAPRAVRLTPKAVLVERLALPDFEIPWSEVTGVQEAPSIELRGQVRRVAGNGGLMGFTGLYSVTGVGTVRCFATRLHRPTVLLSRREGRPVLLGVDEPHRLLEALRRRPLARQGGRPGRA